MLICPFRPPLYPPTIAYLVFDASLLPASCIPPPLYVMLCYVVVCRIVFCCLCCAVLLCSNLVVWYSVLFFCGVSLFDLLLSSASSSVLVVSSCVCLLLPFSCLPCSLLCTLFNVLRSTNLPDALTQTFSLVSYFMAVLFVFGLFMVALIAKVANPCQLDNL